MKNCGDVAEIMLSMLVHEGILTREEVYETDDDSGLYVLLIKKYRERKEFHNKNSSFEKTVNMI